VVALDGVDMMAASGGLTAVVGPSGSGKSTLLRCIAGLEPVDGGRILLDGRDVTGDPPGARNVAMAFQDLALYPHLDVKANIAFGLRASRVPPAERNACVASVAASLSLESLLDRRPASLSGGEAQRVALARAVVRNPQVLLLDEPFGSLDAELRAEARTAVRSTQSRLAVTTVLVTHDPAEAFALADHLVVLRAGLVVQAGSPLELHDRPATPLVARLLGQPPPAIVPASLAFGVAHDSGRLCAVRADAVRLVTPGTGHVDAVVRAVEPTGPGFLVRLVIGSRGEHELSAAVARTSGGPFGVRPGDHVGLTWDRADIWTFPDTPNPGDDAV